MLSFLKSRKTMAGALAIALAAYGFAEWRAQEASSDIIEAKADIARAEEAAAAAHKEAEKAQESAEEEAAEAERLRAEKADADRLHADAKARAERLRRQLETEQQRRQEELDRVREQVPALSQDELAAKVDKTVEGEDPSAHFWTVGDQYGGNRRAAEVIFLAFQERDSLRLDLRGCTRDLMLLGDVNRTCQAALDASDQSIAAQERQIAALNLAQAARIDEVLAMQEANEAWRARYAALRKKSFWGKLRSNLKVAAIVGVGGYIAGVVTSR